MPDIPAFLRRAAMPSSALVSMVAAIARECLRRAQGDSFKACELAQELTHHDRCATVKVVEAMQTIVDQRGAIR
jgi:hypothetical protein